MGMTNRVTRTEFLATSLGALAAVASWPLDSLALGAAPPAQNSPRPDPWPTAIREFAERRQEQEYRRVATELKLGSDPNTAYQRLSGRGLATDFTAQDMNAVLKLDTLFSPEEVKRVGEEAMRLRDAYLKMPSPTRFEDPARYAILALRFDRLREEIAGAGRALTPRPWVATLPSGNLNAFTFPEPTTRMPVIFFEQGLFQFFFDFAMIAAWALPPINQQQLTSDLLLQTIPSKHVMPFEASSLSASSLYAYAVNGSTLMKDKPVPVPQHNALLAYVLVEQMGYFALAHELGHVALQHQGAALSKEDELAADAFALRLVCNLSRKRFGNWALGYLGADLMLLAFNFMYRALGYLAFGDQRVRWIHATHPDPLVRRDALQDPKIVPDAPVIGVLASRTVRAMNDAVLSRLLSLSLVGLNEGYERGGRPSPLWRQMIGTTIAPA